MVNKSFYKLEYPRTTKFHTDPSIPQQMFYLVSFIPSQGAKPDSDGFFGLLKVRGTFPTARDAEEYGDMLLRKYDSFSEIQIGYVGRNLPLVADMTQYTLETKEIDIRKKIEDTVKSEMRKRKEEESKQMEEVQSRQQKLLDKDHRAEEDDSTNNLDFYLTLQNKKAQNLAWIDDLNEKITKAREVIENTREKIQAMDEANPEFKDQYIKQYEDALRNIGVDAEKNPLIRYMRPEYKDYVPPTITEQTTESTTPSSESTTPSSE